MAIAAALVLCMQALIGVLVPAASAGTARVDAFGNPLCISAGQRSDPGKGSHHSLPDCCAVGCNMLTPAAAPPSAPFFMAPHIEREAGQPRGFAFLWSPFHHADQHGSRAPPLPA